MSASECLVSIDGLTWWGFHGGMVMQGKPAMMSVMEHPEDTTAVPPLVDQRVLMQFCQAVQMYADVQGLHEAVAKKLSELQAYLAVLADVAALCRLAILGVPHAFARVVDEMNCIAVDYPAEPLEEENWDGEFCEDESDDRVQLAAAIDLLAGAAFVSKDDSCQRDRFIIGVIRAIENAIAFPVVFCAEAAAYVRQGEDAGGLVPLEASAVIAIATRRLLEGDQACVPRVPAGIRRRLETLARRWMRGNPVTTFLEVLSGPAVRQIVLWEDPRRERPDGALAGDPVTLLLRTDRGEADDRRCERLREHRAMFCPHQPAEIIRVIDDGLQVRVPEQARTGPVAVIRQAPDFRTVWDLLVEFGRAYPAEMSGSIFGLVRMDVWCYPLAFRGPILEIANTPQSATADAFTLAGLLGRDQPVMVGQTVAIHYRVSPAGSEAGAPLRVSAPGGMVNPGPAPGVLFYRPQQPGPNPVELTWGGVTVSVPIQAQLDHPAGRGRAESIGRVGRGVRQRPADRGRACRRAAHRKGALLVL
jgi:hypothetical protein